MPPVSTFLDDSFVGAIGTQITAHAPIIGGAWAYLTGGDNWQLDGSGAVFPASTGTPIATNAAVAPTPDYRVDAGIRVVGVIINPSIIGAAARLVDINNMIYLAWSSSALQLQLREIVAGVDTLLGQVALNVATQPGARADIALELIGATATAYLTGAPVIGPTAVTPAAVGSVGIYNKGIGQLFNNGTALDTITAVG